MPKRLMQSGICFGLAILLTACGGAGIYKKVDLAGPATDLETIQVDPRLGLGRPPTHAARGGS